MRRRKLSAKQWAALRKGWRVLGTAPKGNPPMYMLRKKSSRGLLAIARRRLALRRQQAKSYRKAVRGYKISVRTRPGRKIHNRAFSSKYSIRTGALGTISFRRGRGRGRKTLKTIATNPRRRRNPGRRGRNPALSVSSWKSGVMDLPKALSLFKGKDMPVNALFATGGMVGASVAGGVLRGYIMGAVGQVIPQLAENKFVQGALGAVISYTGGYAVGQLLIKNARQRNAFITGSAVAAILNLIMPGTINGLLTKIPVLGAQLAKLPEMSGYVSAPSYQGVGSYVLANAYQGVGYDDAIAGLGYSQDALAGELGAYVSAPAYQGVGGYLTKSYLSRQ